MLAEDGAVTVETIPQNLVEAFLCHEEVMSIVGHATTAALFSDILGMPVGFNRVSCQLRKGDLLVVGQYLGPRLEGGQDLLSRRGR